MARFNDTNEHSPGFSISPCNRRCRKSPPARYFEAFRDKITVGGKGIGIRLVCNICAAKAGQTKVPDGTAQSAAYVSACLPQQLSFEAGRILYLNQSTQRH